MKTLYLLLLCVYNVHLIKVTVTPSSISYNTETSVNITCHYQPMVHGTPLILQWDYSNYRLNYAVRMYNVFIGDQIRTGPSGIYKYRIANYRTENESQRITLQYTNWCDVGNYQCKFWSDPSDPIRMQFGEGQLDASIGPVYFYIGSQEIEEDVVFGHPVEDIFTCAVFWNTSNINITIRSIKYGSNQSRSGEQVKDCTFKATTSISFKLDYGDVITCVCEARFEGRITIAKGRTLRVSKHDKGEISGLWAFLVLPFAAVAILAFICYRKRKKICLRDHAHPESEKFIKDDETSNLKELLRDFYLREYDKVPYMPWDLSDWCPLSQLYVGLEWERHYREAANIMQEQLDHYMEIFNRLPDRLDPNLIFVLGEPGCGKTVFTKKIAIDWANEDNKLKCFDLVFVLPLCLLGKDESIEEAIYKYILKLHLSFSSEMIKTQIEQLKSRCLIILDGMDEVHGSSAAIENILNKMAFVQNKVIITTRPVGHDTISNADVTMVIHGFEQDGENTYVQKFFKGNNEMAKECREEIEKKGLENISKIPLLLHLICILYNEDTCRSLPETVTRLYESLELFVIKRYRATQKTIQAYTVERHLDSILKQLKLLAYTGICTGQLVFDDSKLSNRKNLYAIGFLSSWKIPTNTKGLCNVKFVHKSFMDYFAAHWIVENFEEVSRFWTIFKNINDVLAVKNLFSFCCGIDPEIGVAILVTMQQMSFMKTWKGLSRFQMEILCEVTEGVDISPLYCFKTIDINSPFQIPKHITFCPSKIAISGLHVHSFTYNSFNVSFKKELNQKMRCLLALDQLKLIQLKKCDLDTDACDSFYKTFAKLSLNNPGVEHLQTLKFEADKCDIADTSLIVRCASNTRCIKTMALYYMDVDLNIALSCPAALTNLQILKLVHCKISLVDLQGLFNWSHFHQLTELNFYSTSLARMLHAAPFNCNTPLSLKRLVMDSCHLTWKDMPGVSKIVDLSPDLVYLSLLGNSAHSYEIQPIYDVLASRKSCIEVNVDASDKEIEELNTKMPQHEIGNVYTVLTTHSQNY